MTSYYCIYKIDTPLTPDLYVEKIIAIYDSIESASAWYQTLDQDNTPNEVDDQYAVKVVQTATTTPLTDVYVLWYKDPWRLNPSMTGLYDTLASAQSAMQNLYNYLKRPVAGRAQSEPTASQMNSRYSISKIKLNQPNIIPFTYNPLVLLEITLVL